MHQVQAVLDESGACPDGGQRQAMGREQGIHGPHRHIVGPCGKHLDAVEAGVGRGPAARLQPAVKHERPATCLRH